MVENRPGAGGSLGAEAVVNAPPDGYTLFFAASSNAVNASLMKNLSYDFVRDTAPVAPINRINLVLDANPSFPATNVAELIAQCKANPGKIVMASPSLGTPPYMAVELFKMMAGVDVVHVPYAGEGQLVTDLLGGQVKVGVDGISAVIGQIKTGKLRAVALTTANRIDELPGVPTVAETLPGFEASGFSGIVAPKNTPTAGHRQARRRGPRHPGRRQIQGAAVRARRQRTVDVARGVRPIHRRGNREVAQGRPVRRAEGAVKVAPPRPRRLVTRRALPTMSCSQSRLPH